MRRRSNKRGAGTALAVTTGIAIVGVAVGPSSATDIGARAPTAAERQAIDAAAQAGDDALISTQVVPPQYLKPLRPAVPGIHHAIAAPSKSEAAVGLAQAQRHIADVLTSDAARRQASAVALAFQQAVPHPAGPQNEAVSIVSVAGGVRDFVVRSTMVDGDEATVVATCTAWLVTREFDADGTQRTFSPANDETDTVTLQKDASGTWRVSNVEFVFANGSGP